MPLRLYDAIDVAYAAALAAGAPASVLDAITLIDTAEQSRWRVAAQKRDYDTRARRLLGARVPLVLYERVKAAADAAGVSLYAWLTDAIRSKLEETG